MKPYTALICWDLDGVSLKLDEIFAVVEVEIDVC
jgi:hypothetical protein